MIQLFRSSRVQCCVGHKLFPSCPFFNRLIYCKQDLHSKTAEDEIFTGRMLSCRQNGVKALNKLKHVNQYYAYNWFSLE